MACMCGDICCSSCGPAQGNWRCPICRAWASDGCEHVDEGAEDIRPEFRAEADRIAREEAEAEAKMIEGIEFDEFMIAHEPSVGWRDIDDARKAFTEWKGRQS